MGRAARTAAAVALLWVCAPAGAAADVADTATEVNCRAGLVVQGGGSCLYPDTPERFEVDAGGQARFLFGAFSGSVDIDTAIDGHRFDIAATGLDEGSWRIDRVGGGNRTNYGTTGTPLTLRALRCTGEASAEGTAVLIEGEVHALSGVSSVTLTGRIEGDLLDVASIGRLTGGDTAPFALKRTVEAAPAHGGDLGCAVDVEYFDIGALRYGEPLRVKWRGSAPP